MEKVLQEDLTVVEKQGTNKNGDAVTYRNIFFKSKADPMTNTLIKGIDVDKYIIIKKLWDKGFEMPAKTDADGKVYKSFSVRAEYLGKDVSFFLNEKQHDDWVAVGEKGSELKVTVEHKPYDNEFGKGISVIPHFELV